MAVDISVVICSRNRKQHLVRTLESLRKLEVPDGLAHEVLLIDNGSTDGTRELMDDFVKLDPAVWKYRSEPEKGLSRARNCGIRHARGEIIAFTDDDVIVDPNWLSALWNTFESKPDVIAVQGKILLQKEIEHLPPWADPEDLLFCTCYDPSPAPVYTDVLVGANMAFRGRAFEKYGYFDPRLGAGASGLGEETEILMRFMDAGEKIYYQPEALIYHEYDEERFTWEYWCQRQKQRAYTNAIIAIQIRKEKISGLGTWGKLARYYAKYFLSTFLLNERKKCKYDGRIRYLKEYMKYAAEMQNSQVLC
jgi:GT2 family glycosyltransferase